MAVATEHDWSLDGHSEAKAHVGSQAAAVRTAVKLKQIDFRSSQTPALAFNDQITHDGSGSVLAPSGMTCRTVKGAGFPRQRRTEERVAGRQSEWEGEGNDAELACPHFSK
jgi:hypothetical protein